MAAANQPQLPLAPPVIPIFRERTLSAIDAMSSNLVLIMAVTMEGIEREDALFIFSSMFILPALVSWYVFLQRGWRVYRTGNLTCSDMVGVVVTICLNMICWYSYHRHIVGFKRDVKGQISITAVAAVAFASSIAAPMLRMNGH